MKNAFFSVQKSTNLCGYCKCLLYRELCARSVHIVTQKFMYFTAVVPIFSKVVLTIITPLVSVIVILHRHHKPTIGEWRQNQQQKHL